MTLEKRIRRLEQVHTHPVTVKPLIIQYRVYDVGGMAEDLPAQAHFCAPNLHVIQKDAENYEDFKQRAHAEWEALNATG